MAVAAFIFLGRAGAQDPQPKLSDAQKQDFVDRLIGFVEGSVEEDDFVDFRQLAERVAEKIEPGMKQDEKVISAMAESLSEGSVPAICRKNLEESGLIHFLRFRERDNKPTALFRLIYSNAGVAYFEYALQFDEKLGKVKASDIFIYTTCEWLSDMEATGALLANSKPSLLNQITKGVKLDDREIKVFDEVCEYSNAGEWNKVLVNYSRLAVSLKQTKFCLMQRFVAAQKLKDFEELRRCIEDLRANVKNDPSIEFLSLDYYNKRKEFAKSLATFDAIEKSVGGDPYLDVQRALILDKAGDIKEAMKFASKAIEREPTLAPAHFLLATFAQSEKDFKAVADIFRTAEKMLPIDLNAIEASPAFAPFVASPEFKAWKADSQTKK